MKGQGWVSLLRPELGALAGLGATLVFFGVVAGSSGMFSALGLGSVLEVSAEIAILAVPVALLMIAGEFDLSVGSMVAFSGMTFALLVREGGWPAWAAASMTLSLAGLWGAFNGLLVVRSRLPSFIVTLASLFVLRGLTLGGTRALTGRTVISGLQPELSSDPLSALLSGHALEPAFNLLAEWGWLAARADGLPTLPGVPVSVLWATSLTFALAWLLTRTGFGNWIYAVGGDADAARTMGVPVARVRVLLFVLTAIAAALLALLQVMDSGSADTNRGLRDEFEAIIAAVIGGTLLSGGYGSVIGAALGALLFGVVQMGIFYTGADTDWFEVFLGLMLLAAVLFNDALRRRIMEARS